MSNEEIAEKIHVLSEKMDRYEKHRVELKKDVQNLTDSQKEILTLLVGSPLNGNKGFVKLMESVEEKVTILEKDIQSAKQTIDNVKFWGKTATLLLTGLFLVLMNYIKDNISR